MIHPLCEYNSVKKLKRKENNFYMNLIQQDKATRQDNNNKEIKMIYFLGTIGILASTAGVYYITWKYHFVPIYKLKGTIFYNSSLVDKFSFLKFIPVLNELFLGHEEAKGCLMLSKLGDLGTQGNFRTLSKLAKYAEIRSLSSHANEVYKYVVRRMLCMQTNTKIAEMEAEKKDLLDAWEMPRFRSEIESIINLNFTDAKNEASYYIWAAIGISFDFVAFLCTTPVYRKEIHELGLTCDYLQYIINHDEVHLDLFEKFMMDELRFYQEKESDKSKFLYHDFQIKLSPYFLRMLIDKERMKYYQYMIEDFICIFFSEEDRDLNLEYCVCNAPDEFPQLECIKEYIERTQTETK
jgi:hypothetical protein